MLRYTNGLPLPPFDKDGNIDESAPNYNEFILACNEIKDERKRRIEIRRERFTRSASILLFTTIFVLLIIYSLIKG